MKFPIGGKAKTTQGLPSVSEQQRYWDRRWDENRLPNRWQLRRGEKVLTFIRSLPVDLPKILDLGCGTGWFTEQLSQIGEVVGIDLSETAINIASSQFPGITFIAGNFFEMLIPAGHFDVVVSQDVIAHVEDQVGFLERIAYILKPRGYLVVTTVNKFVMERTHQPPDPPEHIKQWLTMKALKRLLQPHFSVLSTTTAVPMGDRGILRLINSYKIEFLFGLLISRCRLDTLKEWAGLGCTRVLLARKRL